MEFLRFKWIPKSRRLWESFYSDYFTLPKWSPAIVEKDEGPIWERRDVDTQKVDKNQV